MKEIKLNEKLKELRNESGLLQKDVANALGVSPNAYAHYEQGIREPSVQIIKAICRYYKVSADYLLGLED